MLRLLAGSLLITLCFTGGCVYDNQKDLFPRVVIPDTAIQGQLAWYPFDSSLADALGYQDSLKLLGIPEYGRGYEGTNYGAIVLDGLKHSLKGFIPRNDTLAISLWILPMPNYQKAVLFDYGLGQFSAGLDAVTSATMPRFRMFMTRDTATYYGQSEIDFFFWHHLYIEIGDTINPPRMYIDGYLPETTQQPWRMHPLTDLFYIGRPFNADIMDTMLYRGYIDDVRIFNKLLTEEEILNLFWGGRTPK